MKWSPSTFGTDWLQLSRWDLVKLFFGCRLKVSAMVITTKPKPPRYL